MKLANKVVLVTGSSQGIGQAIAIRLASEGADIILAGRVDDERLQQSVELVREKGRRVGVVAGDISQATTCQYMIDEGVKQMGHIDILVNNAGVEKHAAFWDITEEIGRASGRETG